MARVAIHKEWGFMLHPACMEKNKEEFDPEKFDVRNRSDHDPEVNGRICVECKGEVRLGPASRR